MRKPTIAEQREKAVYILAQRKEENPTPETIAIARRIMNSYYRLCGLDERLLYLENNERTCNSRYTEQQEERRDKWYKRLNKEFSEFNACLVYFGYCSTICKKDSTQDLYLAYFYN